MTTSPEYDAIIARKLKERENISITSTGKPNFISMDFGKDPSFSASPAKKRGRPVGSKNKRKV